ncbi:hypothetical protein M433DRAFT_162915 [Acidomyces richmondensis BFW]|nr:hypothetical protein M433DRAFT_162915 [Acidomyces richmondensis BFW]
MAQSRAMTRGPGECPVMVRASVIAVMWSSVTHMLDGSPFSLPTSAHATSTAVQHRDTPPYHGPDCIGAGCDGTG